ncbi:hypothetical protein RSAG8_11955, partial [Rhizoctonia solani AG-8 WAC10335]
MQTTGWPVSGINASAALKHGPPEVDPSFQLVNDESTHSILKGLEVITTTTPCTTRIFEITALVAMLEELNSASEQLRVALERYLHVCSSIQGICLQGTIPRDIPPEYPFHVDRELSLAESYDTKMQQAKLAIKATLNHAFSISPISCLPPEILTCIFHMARDADPNSVDHLAVVCSRWRTVALSSCSLWSHIDYYPDSNKWLYPELLARARLHISRSNGVPLDVRLSVDSDLYNDNCWDRPVESLCELVAPQTKSLKLELDGFRWPSGGENSVLETLFSKCVPGVLTKFVTMDVERFGFITTIDDRGFGTSTIFLYLTSADLNNVFSSVTVLHLTGLFLRWTSLAYRGLVDLRLCVDCGEDDDTISEAELVRILKASPGLRILHFELAITHLAGRGVAAPRVRLPDLEVLQVKSSYGVNSIHGIEHFLRLLEPGRNPLHLSIRRRSYPVGTELPTTETTAFFARTNTTKLYVTHFPQVLKLLPWLPHLKIYIPLITSFPTPSWILVS